MIKARQTPSIMTNIVIQVGKATEVLQKAIVNRSQLSATVTKMCDKSTCKEGNETITVIHVLNPRTLEMESRQVSVSLHTEFQVSQCSVVRPYLSKQYGSCAPQLSSS